MYQLHAQYLEKNEKITFKSVVEYVNTMDPALLMYCMNMDYRKNEIAKQVVESLASSI